SSTLAVIYRLTTSLRFVSPFKRLQSLLILFFFLITSPPPTPTLFPYTTLFRSTLASSSPLPAASQSCSSESSGSDIPAPRSGNRSEEHTSELQSRENLVCRLLLEKKKLI